MRVLARVALMVLAVVSASAGAQDLNEAEIIVTGSRVRMSNVEDGIESIAAAPPAVGLRRRADFALLPVVVAGDTRETAARREEILAMVRNAIQLAGRSGVELATGDFIVTPLTLDNYRTLAMVSDGRPDSEQVRFYVKTRLGAAAEEANAAVRRLEQFVRTVPASGRAEMRAAGPLTLSVVGPNQYRGQILDLIAQDARAVAARFGPEQAIEAHGLDRPVEWQRSGATELFLYIPHRLVFRPAD
jgi:hypothetical protein